MQVYFVGIFILQRLKDSKDSQILSLKRRIKELSILNLINN